MKKNLVFYIIILIIIIVAVVIYRKYDFNYYSKGIVEINKTSFSRDASEKANTRKRSYKIVNEDYNDALFYKKIPVKEFTPYKISCMVKTSEVEQYENVQVAGAQIVLKDTEEHSSVLAGNNDWTKLEFCFNSKNNTEVEIGFRLGGNGHKAKGTAWFTDLTIEEGILNQDNKWKFACFIFDKVDVDLGNNIKVTERLTYSDIQDIKDNMEKFKDTTSRLSGEKMLVDYNIYEISQPITSLTYDNENGYYIGEKDVYNLINNYMSQEEYDHIFVCAKLPNEAKMGSSTSVDWIGLGNMEYCGKGLSNIRIVNNQNRYNNFPEEVYLHEFLHTLERNAKEYGFERPELHDYSKYGYEDLMSDGLRKWYRDYMNKTISSNGMLIGLPLEIYTYKPANSSNFKNSAQLDLLDDPKNILESAKSLWSQIKVLFEKQEEIETVNFVAN